MLTAFEATIVGFFLDKPGSRYDLLKILRRRRLYWSGSSGALYSAIDRLTKKDMLREVEGGEIRLFQTTELGRKECALFFRKPVPALKIISDPALMRLKLRASLFLSPSERTSFYQGQQSELIKAETILKKERKGIMGEKISEDLADLTIAQIRLDYEFINELLEKYGC